MLRLFMVLFYWLMNPLNAASFDCSKASRPLDKTICQHAPLSELDEKMAKMYFELRESLPSQQVESLLKAQRQWLKERSQSCKTTDADCLISMYQKRLEALQQRLQTHSAFLAQRAQQAKGWQLQSGQDKPLCQDVLATLQANYPTSSPRFWFSPEGKPFKALDWEVLNYMPYNILLQEALYEKKLSPEGWLKEIDRLEALSQQDFLSGRAVLPWDYDGNGTKEGLLQVSWLQDDGRYHVQNFIIDSSQKYSKYQHSAHVRLFTRGKPPVLSGEAVLYQDQLYGFVKQGKFWQLRQYFSEMYQKDQGVPVSPTLCTLALTSVSLGGESS
ncbi:MAG: lysozyme inhibitor LprI family protein [Pseudomonadota bacterium]